MRRLFLFSCAAVALLLIATAPARGQSPGSSRAIVEGTVINAASGAPLASARVKLRTTDGSDFYTRTNADGHFQFSVQGPLGTYFLNAQQPGFLGLSDSPMLLNLDLGPRPGRSFSMQPAYPTVSISRSTDEDGTVRVKVQMPLMPYTVIAGKVTGPDGVPISSCNLEVMQVLPPGSDSRPPLMNVRTLPDGRTEVGTATTARTDDRGEFRVARLKPGTYYIVATGAGDPGAWDQTYRATYFSQAVDLASAKPIVLAAGQQANPKIRILSQTSTHVMGKLRAAGGLPAFPDFYTRLEMVPAAEFLLGSNHPLRWLRKKISKSRVCFPASTTCWPLRCPGTIRQPRSRLSARCRPSKSAKAV